MKEKETKNNYEGKHYIVRGDRSGVFFGEIEERNGKEVTLRNCRRLWYWSGANSLSELALRGTQNPHNCKFTVTVDRIQVLDAIEIDECTESATKNILEVPVWEY